MSSISESVKQLEDGWQTMWRSEHKKLPIVTIVLVASIIATAIYTGTFLHNLSSSVAGWGSFGWPSLVAGRYWTLPTSFFLTRNWFMALTMPIALLLSLGVYERRAGSARAAAVAISGHVVGSVVFAFSAGLLGYSGIAVFVRAAQNLDYGGSDVVAAALGGLIFLTYNKSWRVVGIAIAIGGLLVHHQSADWTHLIAFFVGYVVADMKGLRRPRHTFVVAAGLIGVTSWITYFGSGTVQGAVDVMRYRRTPSFQTFADPAPRPIQVDHSSKATAFPLAYTATTLNDRPEIAWVHKAGKISNDAPIIIFLHAVPGTASDWIFGGDLTQQVDTEVSRHDLPPVVAVLPETDDFHKGNAGWNNVSGQMQLTSIEHDLIPEIRERYNDHNGSLAVVGIGRGADGAVALAKLDAGVQSVVAIDPHTDVKPTSSCKVVKDARLPSRQWRLMLDKQLNWLGDRLDTRA